MKILWICNIMPPQVAVFLKRESSNKEGWIAGLLSFLLKNLQENVSLHIAFPVEKGLDGLRETVLAEGGKVYAYGFYEDTLHPERYEPALEKSLGDIVREAQPDVVHCFGTEYAHCLALFKSGVSRERVLVSMQGICQVIARAYMADLPERVQNADSFRDLLKKDGLRQQQRKMRLRGEREIAALEMAQYVAGRTGFDRYYVKKANPQVHYEVWNETLRECFYEGKWEREKCVPYRIFVSQGDYPLKGLHYMLLAMGKLQKRYPEIQLCVAGNSLVDYESLRDKIKISGYGRYLRRLMKEQALEGRVTFAGKLSAEQMKEQYLRCSVYVCCSANENSPNSLGEAMLLGVPCVAAKAGGIPDMFEDGKDGILYEGSRFYLEEGDYGFEKSGESGAFQGADGELERIAEALGKAIAQIWEKPQQTEVFCGNARSHAKRTHDGQVNNAKMMEIYGRIAGNA